MAGQQSNGVRNAGNHVVQDKVSWMRPNKVCHTTVLDAHSEQCR